MSNNASDLRLGELGTRIRRTLVNMALQQNITCREAIIIIVFLEDRVLPTLDDLWFKTQFNLDDYKNKLDAAAQDACIRDEGSDPNSIEPAETICAFITQQVEDTLQLIPPVRNNQTEGRMRDLVAGVKQFDIDVQAHVNATWAGIQHVAAGLNELKEDTRKQLAGEWGFDWPAEQAQSQAAANNPALNPVAPPVTNPSGRKTRTPAVPAVRWTDAERAHLLTIWRNRGSKPSAQLVREHLQASGVRRTYHGLREQAKKQGL